MDEGMLWEGGDACHRPACDWESKPCAPGRAMRGGVLGLEDNAPDADTGGHGIWAPMFVRNLNCQM